MTKGLTFRNEYFEEGSKAISTNHRKIAITTVDKAIAYMIQNFGEDLTLDDLGLASGITKFNLCRSFQKRFGITPMKWLWTFRTLLAAEFIRMAPSWSLTDIAFTCGFTSSAHFSRSFSMLFSMSPSQFRRLAKEDRVSDEKKVDSLCDYGVVYEDNEAIVQQAYERMVQHLQAPKG